MKTPSSFRPSGIAAFLVAFAALFVSSEAQQTTESPTPIAAALQPFVDDHVLAGAVTLVADKDRVLDLEAVGYADVATKRSMRTDDVFWIASMSKPITAVALMMLVDEGKVSLDDPVAKYLPEFSDVVVLDKKDKGAASRKPKSPILVRHLLSLTSGMEFKSDMEKQTLDVGTLAERVSSYAKMPLDFDPGTNYQYSNASINTAGRIIEVVSGMSYESFLDERLFKPLEMPDTTFWPNESQLARLAKAYRGNKDKSDIEETPIDLLRHPLSDRTRQPVPGGGLFSTAVDMAHFAQMVLNHGVYKGKRYLSEAAVAQMVGKQTPDSVAQGYGFGFRTNGTNYGHFGKYGTNMSIDSKRGIITLFMVQNAGWRNDEGKKIHPTFHKTAMDAFGR